MHRHPGFTQPADQQPLVAAGGFAHCHRGVLGRQVFYQLGDASGRVVEPDDGTLRNGDIEVGFADVNARCHCHAVASQFEMKVSSALADAGPKPMYPFGAPTVARGCHTAARCSRWVHQAHPVACDAPLPPTLTISLLPRQIQHTSCLNYLHRLGFAFKRPKKRLVKADEGKREAFVRSTPSCERRPNGLKPEYSLLMRPTSGRTRNCGASGC